MWSDRCPIEFWCPIGVLLIFSFNRTPNPFVCSEVTRRVLLSPIETDLYT